MGMRRNIECVYSEGSVFFYTHWGAESLKEELKNALVRGKGRWGDDPYLARIIFSEMVKGDIDGLTGYGIAPYVMDDEYPTIKVDLRKQTVNGTSFEEYIKGDYTEDDN